MRKLFKWILIILAILMNNHQVHAKEYIINSGSELKTINLQPGDKVILKQGIWKNELIKLKGQGTKENPITLTAQLPWQALIGNSNLIIDGEWLVVEGITFENGSSLGSDVIIFSKQSKNCRLTNCQIIDYNPILGSIPYKWVSIYGNRNRVDHCKFTGKNNEGPTVAIWVSDVPNFHMIDNNYFGERPSIIKNNSETIRIGASSWALFDSFTTVTKNVFEKCNGEIELISVKSSRNLIANNLFYECKATVSLRHGNNSEVSYNYFIGNDVKLTGGVRITGENQIVKNNYFYKIEGNNLRSPISVMNASDNPDPTKYKQVRNAKIFNNIFVKCKEAFSLGSGETINRNILPNGVSIEKNFVYRAKRILIINDSLKDLKMNENLGNKWRKINGFSKSKLKPEDYEIKITGNDNTLVPFWQSKIIGPTWINEEFITTLK
jgi:poly(beta-D-mannuronate) lyase